MSSNYYYTVFWDNSNGTDWDESFSRLSDAMRKYNALPASVPFKSLVMTDKVHGDRTVLNSKGENNLSKFDLAGVIA